MTNLKFPYYQLVERIAKILLKHNFDAERAQKCAVLFVNANLDGVASHGLNRFPLFLKMIREGFVDATAKPSLMGAFGFFERWDGNLGPGNLNAWQCMDRAVTLSKAHGVGCVALRNTNHWMRGGAFGWQAVENGCMAVCFTNTKPNMPAWGGNKPKLGNNPLILAIPRYKEPLVLDMAVSQFSYGKINTYLKNKELLPYYGGFDQDGNLTREPAVILENELALPVGLWKGAGLSLFLDILASVLSEGNSTSQIGKEESALSQVFICLYPAKLGISPYPDEKIDNIINDLKSSSVFGKSRIRFPGENVLTTRAENMEKGIPVDRDIWEQILQYPC